VFFLVGMLLSRTLKLHFPGFYKRAGNKVPSFKIKPFQLLLATFILSGSLIIRSLLNLIRNDKTGAIDKLLDESREKNTLMAPLFNVGFFIFADVLPIGAQLFSMIFGLVRRQEPSILETQETEQLVGTGEPPSERSRSIASCTSNTSFFDPPLEYM